MGNNATHLSEAEVAPATATTTRSSPMKLGYLDFCDSHRRASADSQTFTGRMTGGGSSPMSRFTGMGGR